MIDITSQASNWSSLACPYNELEINLQSPASPPGWISSYQAELEYLELILRPIFGLICLLSYCSASLRRLIVTISAITNEYLPSSALVFHSMQWINMVEPIRNRHFRHLLIGKSYNGHWHFPLNYIHAKVNKTLVIVVRHSESCKMWSSWSLSRDCRFWKLIKTSFPGQGEVGCLDDFPDWKQSDRLYMTSVIPSYKPPVCRTSFFSFFFFWLIASAWQLRLWKLESLIFSLRQLFEGAFYKSNSQHCNVGLQINDIEPFCQDEIALYRQCAEKRVRLWLLCFFYFPFQFVTSKNWFWNFMLGISHHNLMLFFCRIRN